MTQSGDTLGPYQLEDALGGTRTVFRARHVVSGDVVCVKLLPEHLRLDAINRGRRKRELMATRQVEHAAVGRPLDFVDAGGRLFLVMEYVEGAPLSMALFGGVTLPVSRALRVVRGACEAVAAAHAAHATHGCLEPDKVLVAQDSLIHVVGFGFRDEDALKHPGSDAPEDVDVCTAPERWSGAFETPEADVWALGALLYRCLSGGYPFEAATRAELSHLVQTSDVVPPRFEAGVVEKPAIEAVVLRALSRDPVLRYPDAAVLARALVELEAMLPPDEDTTDVASDHGPIVIDAADVEPISAEEPPPPPEDDEAIAALAALEDAIQSHEAFVDPFAAGLLQGPEALPTGEAPPSVPPPPHAEHPSVEESADESTDVTRARIEATTVEAPSLDGTTVERPSVEVPSLALPSFEAASPGVSSVALPLVDAPAVEVAAGEDTPLAEAPPVDGGAAEGDDVDLDDDEDGPAEPLPLPPPLEEKPVVVSLPAVEEHEPRRRPVGLWAAGLAAVAAAGAFVLLDPLGLRASDDAAVASAAATTPVTATPTPPVPSAAAPEPAAETEPAAASSPDAGVGASGDMNAALLAAAADAGLAAAAAGDAGAGARVEVAAAAEDTASEAEGDEAPEANDEPRTPKEELASAEEALERTLEERGLLWKDSRKLDRLRLKARRQARARRYQAAARTTEAAVEAASEVDIDERLVKRKLLRYVKRRKQTRDDDVAKRARALETRARKHLKDDEPAKANELLNAGLRLMYTPDD